MLSSCPRSVLARGAVFLVVYVPREDESKKLACCAKECRRKISSNSQTLPSTSGLKRVGTAGIFSQRPSMYNYNRPHAGLFVHDSVSSSRNKQLRSGGADLTWLLW
ncbi:hypothetical protein Bbelb_149160 [Branchiostoma belcheri]|nr:hypothetical protein Bbelb_149160 [Branchiostoma belcheri]